MTSKEAFEDLEYIVLDFCDKYGKQDKYVKELIEIIKKDLDMLEFIKTHYKMNGFNELIPKYDEVDKFSELEEWLENDN